MATVAGIDIRVHASMMLLVGLIVLASAGEPGGEWAGVMWLVLLFGSVLVHELAHSVVALHAGVGVTEIELLPIGGVSKMERIPDQPSDELAIAAAGPLTSLAIGMGSLGLALAFGAGPWPPDLYEGGLFARLGWLNLILAGFNLLPALPLDGGRVFRALLERRIGPTQATHLAARTGRYFAIAMIVAGVLVNIWLILIGVFVYVAAESEDAGAVLHEKLGVLSVTDVMLREPIVVSPSTSVADLAQLLHATAQRQFPVVADGEYVGMIDVASLAQPAAVVGDLIDEVPPIASDTPLDEVALHEERGIRAVAVVTDGAVVGLVQLADVDRLVNAALRQARP